MFHVDYSYLFGDEPHVKTLVSSMSSCMKLTPSILDVMGGEHSKYFKMFHEQSQLIFRLLRSRVHNFFVCASPS